MVVVQVEVLGIGGTYQFLCCFRDMGSGEHLSPFEIHSDSDSTSSESRDLMFFSDLVQSPRVEGWFWFSGLYLFLGSSGFESHNQGLGF